MDTNTSASTSAAPTDASHVHGSECGCTHDKKFARLLDLNRQWAEERVATDPSYFQRLLAQQAPEYLWIGCADSRVPANVIAGLAPGEVFVQRNVGNQAMHTDMNTMSCIEYAVTALRVKTIITCGHYGCGAVKGALSMPSKTQGLVNCWISDIRECRNQHHNELKALGTTEEQIDRLCELNVMRQTFHVCTSPVVQNAWDSGQELSVYGVIYSLKDGLMKKLVGPLTRDNACLDILEYEAHMGGAEAVGEQTATMAGSPLARSVSSAAAALASVSLQSTRKSSATGEDAVLESPPVTPDAERTSNANTLALASAVAAHANWA
ncbi:hypothetical protein FOA52_003053 [Chlamydomonas sp. UWO 241]|nr:hypothetical protein FOA52_003053 [Chlamydomonas sp. UWO 241]